MKGAGRPPYDPRFERDLAPDAGLFDLCRPAEPWARVAAATASSAHGCMDSASSSAPSGGDQ